MNIATAGFLNNPEPAIHTRRFTEAATWQNQVTHLLCLENAIMLNHYHKDLMTALFRRQALRLCTASETKRSNFSYHWHTLHYPAIDQILFNLNKMRITKRIKNKSETSDYREHGGQPGKDQADTHQSCL